MNDSDASTKHSDPPTLDDHPGLDNDEATDEGKMMTGSGSLGPTVNRDAEDGEQSERADDPNADSSA
ncbi:hypothetical protein [Gaiella sp.]|uniref:hypothetical protein n=1 Tax=Gaiella sp. TaxID=2663207 RepID=UPI003982EB2E